MRKSLKQKSVAKAIDHFTKENASSRITPEQYIAKLEEIECERILKRRMEEERIAKVI
jgi:hypothetical protein